MRAILSLLILLAALADHALAESRPAALPNWPATEYVVRFSERLGRETRIVYHRDGKTRIDAAREHGVESTYRDRRHGTVVTIFRKNGDDARYHMLQIRSGAEPGYSTSGAVRTGKSESILGQQCDIWSTTTTGAHMPHAISKENCLTDDGIDLSYRLVGSAGSVITSSAAVAVERRSVDPAEVEIPREVFNLGYWLEAGSKVLDNGPHPADFETTFVWPAVGRFRPDEKIRTTRRHFPWLFERTASGDQKNFVVHNLGAEVVFRFDIKNSGAYKTLLVARDVKPLDINHAEPMKQTDVILGERCEWFNMYPGAMDGGLEQCRTHDGIILKERVIVRYSGETVAALRFQRRPVEVSQVTPPPEILTPAYWGLP